MSGGPCTRPRANTDSRNYTEPDVLKWRYAIQRAGLGHF